jgi:hypothetical protein
MWKL